MQRIAITIAVVLSGLLAACGQQSPAAGEAGAPAAQLDFIEAVPMDKDAPAPVAQPRPATRKDEPEADREPVAEDKAPDAEARTAPPPPAEPAAKADDAMTATRRANETTATPDVVVATETPYRPNQALNRPLM